jgi:chromate transport protein ChrA
MKVSQMRTSEVLVLLAIVIAVIGAAIYGIHPAHKPRELGWVLIAVAAVFAIGAGAWAISERHDP